MAKKASRRGGSSSDERGSGGATAWAELVVEQVPPGELTPDPDNAMTHPEANRSAVRESIQRFGLVEPFVVYRGVVLGGNLRLEIASEMGAETVPVVRVDHLTEQQARALAIALNQTGRLGEWDEERLAAQLRELAGEGFLPSIGFTDAEVVELLKVADEKVLIGELPEAPPDGVYREQYGVIVICSDESHQAEVYQRLLGEGLEVKVVTT